jgi:hypothetical protein
MNHFTTRGTARRLEKLLETQNSQRNSPTFKAGGTS